MIFADKSEPSLAWIAAFSHRKNRGTSTAKIAA
jgi:hypothetical protein